MQPFGVKVLGSFFLSFSPDMDIPKGKNSTATTTGPWWYSTTPPRAHQGERSLFPGDATLLQCCGSTATVPEDTLEGFKWSIPVYIIHFIIIKTVRVWQKLQIFRQICRTKWHKACSLAVHTIKNELATETDAVPPDLNNVDVYIWTSPLDCR